MKTVSTWSLQLYLSFTFAAKRIHFIPEKRSMLETANNELLHKNQYLYIPVNTGTLHWLLSVKDLTDHLFFCAPHNYHCENLSIVERLCAENRELLFVQKNTICILGEGRLAGTRVQVLLPFSFSRFEHVTLQRVKWMSVPLWMEDTFHQQNPNKSYCKEQYKQQNGPIKKHFLKTKLSQNVYFFKTEERNWNWNWNYEHTVSRKVKSSGFSLLSWHPADWYQNCFSSRRPQQEKIQ